MSAIEWRQRRDVLAQKLKVMNHFINKCTCAVKRAAMEKEASALNLEFKKSYFFAEASARTTMEN